MTLPEAENYYKTARAIRSIYDDTIINYLSSEAVFKKLDQSNHVICIDGLNYFFVYDFDLKKSADIVEYCGELSENSKKMDALQKFSTVYFGEENLVHIDIQGLNVVMTLDKIVRNGHNLSLEEEGYALACLRENYFDGQEIDVERGFGYIKICRLFRDEQKAPEPKQANDVTGYHEELKGLIQAVVTKYFEKGQVVDIDLTDDGIKITDMGEKKLQLFIDQIMSDAMTQFPDMKIKEYFEMRNYIYNDQWVQYSELWNALKFNQEVNEISKFYNPTTLVNELPVVDAEEVLGRSSRYLFGCDPYNDESIDKITVVYEFKRNGEIE